MSQASAHRSYDSACFAYRSYLGDPVAACDELLLEMPDHIDAHLLRACALTLSSERRFLGEARSSVEAAEQLAGSASDAQRALTAAARALTDGRWDEAGRLLDAVLVADPTHVAALQTAHVLDFMTGDAVSLRNRPARLLRAWPTEDPARSYVLGMYAFGLEECNEFERAEAVGREAVETDPRDAWATHAVAHVLEMQGRAAQGEAWLADTSTHWRSGGLACHNWWHKALFHIEQDDLAGALAIVDDQILDSVSDASLELVDVSAMLLRLKLLGIDVQARASAIASLWADKLAEEPGYYAFNDFHAAMAFVLVHDEAKLRKLRENAILAVPTLGPSSAAMTREVGLPLLNALERYARADYAAAADQLDRVRPVCARFGGSNAQRDIINWLLIDAARHAGQRERALQLLEERLQSKPAGQLGWRWREALIQTASA